METNKEDVREAIRRNYAQVAAEGAGMGCCAGGCCCGGAAASIQNSSNNLGYTHDDLSNIPQEANMGLGCGNPVAFASLQEGETVLDLGCGGGLDCFIASRKVGKSGYVIGVDMTPDMISLARRNSEKGGFSNVDFRLGEIEHLPVADASVDVVISNCVVNLSLDKDQVIKEVFRVLKKNGRLSISDVVATTKLPEQIKRDLDLISSCIGGAEYIEDLRQMLQNAGFTDVRLTPKENSKEIVESWGLADGIVDYVASYNIEAIK